MERTIVWIANVTLAALVIAGCAATSIRQTNDCGSFESHSVSPFFSSADEYARYSSACATARFADMVAAQRAAIVAAAWRVVEQTNTAQTAADAARHAPELIAEDLIDQMTQRAGTLLILVTTCAASAEYCAATRGRMESALVIRRAFTVLDYTGFGRADATKAATVRAIAELGRSTNAAYVLLLEMHRMRNSPALNVNARIVSTRDATIVASANRIFDP